MASDLSKFKLVTHEFRLSYPALITPKPSMQKGGAPEWGCTMLFNKSVKGIEKLQNAILAVGEEKWGPDRNKWPKPIRNPIRDGDKEKGDKDGYAGHWFVKASHKKSAPGVVGPTKQAILNEAEVYAGCYCRAEILAYCYDNEFGKGFGFSLQNVQKIRDGEPFSGKSDPEDIFDKVESDADNEANYPAAQTSDGLGF